MGTLRYLYSEERGRSFLRTIGTVVAERTLDVVIVFLLLALGAGLLLAGDTSASWLFAVVGLAALVVVGLATLLVAMGLFQRQVARRLPRRLQEAYHNFHQGTLGSFRQVLLVSLLGLLGWLSEVGRFYLVSQALGIDLSMGTVILATVTSAILSLAAITPGGLGIVEPGFVALLKRLSIAGSQALPLVLLDRSISFLSVIVSGAFVFVAGWVLKRRRPARSSALARGD